MYKQIRSSPLFSLQRLLFAFLDAFVLAVLDMFVIHLLGIITTSELPEQTVIHSLGFYLVFTIMTEFRIEIRF